MTFTTSLSSASTRIPQWYHLSITIAYTLRQPIAARKSIIDACQMEDFDEIHMRSSIRHRVVPHPTNPSMQISVHDFITALEDVVCSHIKRSILWMVARTCPEPTDDDESEQVREDGFNKEFEASQSYASFGTRIDYRPFFRYGDQKTVRLFTSIRNNFITGASKLGLLFPRVNRLKTMSDHTKNAMSVYCDEYPETTSRDLEVYYSRTGVMVQGESEMRSAWKFNDLKPRMYYACGGTEYWLSRYFKKIATMIMESIPATAVKTRTYPDTQVENELEEDYIVTWDFTSFTTSLAELKHFVWYLARIYEAAGTTITVFDYRYGKTILVLSDLLDAYNEGVNMGSPFSLHRVIDKYVDFDQWHQHQFRNGMLGIPGNIGLSTALHGLVIQRECGFRRGVSVGDDGLGVVKDDPNTRLIPALRPLGTIHTDKFKVLHPGEDGAFKFLKRRFQRVGNTFIKGLLLSLPISPYVDGIPGIRDTPPSFTEYDRIYKTCTVVGTLLWEIQGLHLPPEDLMVLKQYLYMVYRYLRLPVRGMLSGGTLTIGGNSTEIGFTVPCIEGFDYTTDDWLERLFSTTDQMFFRVPTFVVETVPYIEYGSSVVLSEHPWIAAMEDMEYVTTQVITELLFVGSVSNRAVLRRILKGEKDFSKGYLVTCVKPIPDCLYITERRPVAHDLEDIYMEM